MKKFSKNNRFLHYKAALTATFFSLLLSTQVQASIWDLTDIKYSTDDPDRQWLNFHHAGTAEPAPVYFFAHGNGGTAGGMTQGQLDTIASAGYTTVSWGNGK